MSEASREQFEYALKSVALDIADLDYKVEQLRDQRARLMVDARRAGMKYAEIATFLGVTKAYVHQQVTKATKAEQDDT